MPGLDPLGACCLFLLGACANGADAPAVAVPQAPSARPAAQSASLPPRSPPPTRWLRSHNGGQIAALDPSIGRGEPDGLTAIASSAADSSVDEILGDLKSAPEAPVPAPPVVAPDGRTAAAVVAARPPGTAVGYLLIDLETGQVLAELNPDLPLIRPRPPSSRPPWPPSTCSAPSTASTPSCWRAAR